MSKTLNQYITTLEYADKNLLVLSDASSGVSLSSFNTVIGITVGTASAAVSLVSLISNGFLKMFPKTMGRKKDKHRKIALLVRSKIEQYRENNI